MKRFAVALMLAGMQLASWPAHSTEITRSLLPSFVPDADEIPILGVPLVNVHKAFEQCLSDATASLNDSAGPPVSVGSPHFYMNQRWGYLLRADFSRGDVTPPSVNRIVCWTDGQIVASRLAILPLGPVEASHPLAVPGIRKP